MMQLIVFKQECVIKLIETMISHVAELRKANFYLLKAKL